MKDLTKGKPSRLILAFALPIFLANLLQLTYSLVDTRIVGSFLGEDALAAVGATSSLSNLIIGFLMGLSNGFAIVTAQRFGAKDLRGVKKSFAMSLTLGIAVAAGLTVLGLLFLQPILRFLNVPENLRTMAGSYIVIIIAGLIATFLYDACAAALRALGDTITPLVILAISVILNIAGDLFFVVVLKTGVRGAAVATVSAQALAFVICWIYMIKRYELLRLSGDDFKEPQPQMIQSMLSAGLSMGFMSSDVYKRQISGRKLLLCTAPDAVSQGSNRSWNNTGAAECREWRTFFTDHGPGSRRGFNIYPAASDNAGKKQQAGEYAGSI